MYLSFYRFAWGDLLIELFRNEFFTLSVGDVHVYIQVFAQGFNMKDMNGIIARDPRIKLTNFGLLNKSIQEASNEQAIIGGYRPKVDLEISRDEMTAFIRVYQTQAEVDVQGKELVNEIMEVLKDNGINTGLKRDIFEASIIANQKIVVAEGVAPINGDDAIVKYYEASQRKPESKKDGSVNHYELNLIDQVHKEDWLGEKIPATLGKPGVSVRGEEIPPKEGKDKKIKFDPKTVESVEQAGKEVLKAKVDGAVRFRDGKIGVDNHLIIKQEVGYSTGNVDFDGYVTVDGTVKDGFSVIATQDIVINGDMGVGACDKIHSKKGSVFIKGGISGKGTAQVIAGKDIFVKFSNETYLEAGLSINVGFYAIDSTLKAKKINVNPNGGRVIGGEILAEHQIIAGTIGNKFEKKTVVNVKGFERGDVKQQLDNILVRYKELIKEADTIRRQLDVFESHMAKLDEKALYTYKMMTMQYEGILDTAVALNDKVTELQEVLKTRGEGEVKISNAMYPKTFMEIKNLQKRVTELSTGSFYVKDSSMHFDN